MARLINTTTMTVDALPEVAGGSRLWSEPARLAALRRRLTAIRRPLWTAGPAAAEPSPPCGSGSPEPL